MLGDVMFHGLAFLVSFLDIPAPPDWFIDRPYLLKYYLQDFYQGLILWDNLNCTPSSRQGNKKQKNLF